MKSLGSLVKVVLPVGGLQRRVIGILPIFGICFANSAYQTSLLASSLARSLSSWGSKKAKLRPKQLPRFEMEKEQAEQILAPLRAAVKEQGDLVRSLKQNGAAELDIKKAVAELKTRKKILEDKEVSLTTPAKNGQPAFDRARMEDLLKRRFFYDQSFALYGGITGQFDFGPMGCALKANMLDAWKKHFVLEEQMLEVDCSILTPEPVLQASGHVERFADLMVKDLTNGECFRLDHLIKAHLEKLSMDKKTTQEQRKEYEDIIVRLDGMNKEEMGGILKRFSMTSPTTGNALSEPLEFNLMFATQIGPTGLIKGYLRPETAQGIFVNFKRLLEFNQGRLPFAAAQIGQAFRNEISPRSGLIRLREFTMAEIEHFCDPSNKSHPKFASVSNEELLLYSACDQMDGLPSKRMAIGKAVKSGLVANETLGYFLARIHQFLLKVGVDSGRLRFRQHMANEMAHYATDCWDAEILTSYGWVECVGCADRSAFDLTQHAKATGQRLSAERRLSEPRQVTIVEAQPQKGALGKAFKADAKTIVQTLQDLDKTQLEEIQEAFQNSGQYTLKTPSGNYDITSAMVQIKTIEKTLHVEEFTPSVIEPSFGVGRVMYAILEHSFRQREGDEQRTFFALPALVAPVKCSVLPLSNAADLVTKARDLSSDLTRKGISHKVDDSSGSIGRRYSRTDEIAVPYGCTIDFDSLKDNTATLRDRDTMRQVRMSIDLLPEVILDLSLNRISWSEIEETYPKFEQQETTKASA